MSWLHSLRVISSLLAVPLIAVSSILTHGCARPAAAVPEHVYLVMQGSLTDSMTVQFQSASAIESRVDFDTTAPAEGAAYGRHANGTSRQVKDLPDKRYVHAVSLEGLEADTRYYFRTATGRTGSFRTLAGGDAPVRVLFGGDLGTDPLEEQLLKVAASKNPDVAVLGGDIAYCDGKLRNIDIWDEWFRRWEEHMHRADGTMIPMVVAIGNHELNDSGSSDPAVLAPFYTAFFEQGGSAHFVRDLAPYARLVVLDSDYLASEEAQVPFLRNALQSARERAYLIPCYHVALFPTYYGYDQDHPTAGRKYWTPLFDEFNVPVAFEHHDHVFKRSKPIRGVKVDPTGTVYLGDGGMGKEAREVKNAGAWYLEKAEQRSHFWLAEISPTSMQCDAIDVSGAPFDSITFAPRKEALAPNHEGPVEP